MVTTGMGLLKKSNYSWKIPRQKHRKGDPQAQAEFKSQLPEKVRQLQVRNPGATVEVWFMDEHRVGLKPIMRRTWTPIGSKPVAIVEHRYEWLYVYGFVHPQSGRTHWFLIPRVNIEWFNLAISSFAAALEVSEHTKVMLVLDRAGWHRSPQVE